jgi:hypothetical protein
VEHDTRCCVIILLLGCVSSNVICNSKYFLVICQIIVMVILIDWTVFETFKPLIHSPNLYVLKDFSIVMVSHEVILPCYVRQMNRFCNVNLFELLTGCVANF